MSTNQDEAIARSQRIVDLRARMLANIQKGLPSHEGIDQEELRQVLSDLRSSRATAGARGGTAKAAKAAATPAKAPSASLAGALSSLGLDLD